MEEKSEKIVVTNFGNDVDNVLNQNFGIAPSFERHVDYEVVDISGKRLWLSELVLNWLLQEQH